MNGPDIIHEIDKKMGGVSVEGKSNLTLAERYPYWYIGVTDNPDNQKAHHAGNGDDVEYWRSWPASSEKIAYSVRRYFKNRGMRGGTGGSGKPTHVYIF